MFGVGSVFFGANTPKSGGVAAVLAQNGVSIDPGSTASNRIVDWGQVPGAVGNPAALLNNREIPTGGFNTLFSGIDVSPVFTWQDDVLLYDNYRIKILGTNSAGSEIFRLAYSGDIPGDEGSIYIGYHAGQFATGHENFALGWRALEQLTTGGSNVAVGYEGLLACTTGFANIAIGSDPMNNLTTGGNNIAIGGAVSGGAPGITTGNKNIVLGSHAGPEIGSGNENIFMGFSTGYCNTLPAQNTNGNIFIGGEICATSGYGTNNIVIGTSVNFLINGVMGDNNVWLGAGVQSAGGVSNSVLLGYGMTCNVSNVVRLGRADQNTIVGSTVDIADNGSRLQVLGSVSLPILSTAVPLLLDSTMHTIIVTDPAAVLTGPAAAAAKGRVYKLVNQAAVGVTFSYVAFNGIASTVLPANSAIEIQSDGVNWNRIQ